MTKRSAHSLEVEAELREIRRLLALACRKHPPLKKVELAKDWDKWVVAQIGEAITRVKASGRSTTTTAGWTTLGRLAWLEEGMEDALHASRVHKRVPPEDRTRAEQARARKLAREFHLRLQEVATETGDMGLRVLAGWFAYWAQP